MRSVPMRNPVTWKVHTATVNELEERLNALARDGYEVFNLYPMGAPEPLSDIPRERKALEERTTFAIVARKAPA